MKKQIITATFIILGSIAIFGFSINSNNQHVLNVIESECNCESITQGLFIQGISYSKDSGMNLGDSHYFTLQNCTFEDFENDIKSLTKTLSTNIDNFCASDVVTLNIKQENEVIKKVIIKDCSWTTK